MLQPSWLRRLTSRPRAAFRAPPCLETLEERCLLTTLVGVTTAGAFGTLVRFDSTTPNMLTPIGAISGVTAGQKIVALDFDPLNNQLFGLGFGGGVGQIYTFLNPNTAAASAVGTPFSTKLTGTEFGFSIDPVANQIRVIDNAGENLRVSPSSGALLSTDTPINPSSDTITAAAYSNNLPGATQTTLYGYDEANNNIVTVGSINGSPNSANTGTISLVGKSGFNNSNAGADLGFAIDANGAAYLNLMVGGVSGFYTANLSTGAVTFVNSFGVGVTMADITVAPAVGFSVTGVPASRTASLASNFFVTAQTIYGTTATGYAGTVAFTSSDPAAVLPSNSPLVNGTDTFTVTFNTPGIQSITATDTISHITGSQTGINVLANTELVGVTTNNQLVRFFSASPGNVTTIGTFSGLAAGQNIVAVAFRPSTGGLYGLGYGSGTGQIYTINPTTAVATAVGGPFSTTISGVDFGFSFDPTQDLIRITTNANENFRVDPNTGALISQDTILTPTSADVVGLAYFNNFDGAATTTLYGYNVANDNLVIVGSAGSDTSSNGGVVSSIGPSGVTSDSIGGPSETGFAIDADGAAYVNLDVSATSDLFTINLSNGLVAENGEFASGIAMRDIAVAPATGFSLGNLGSPHVAGATSPVTVTAIDAYGNVAVGYVGSVTFRSSDAAAALPANITLTNGTGTTNVTFKTVGSQSFTATDAVNPNTTSTVSGIPVVSAVDLVGLTAGNQLVHFSSSTPNAITTVGPITGVASGQTLVAIDFRPANDQLYGLAVGGGTGQLYTIDPTTGVATACRRRSRCCPRTRAMASASIRSTTWPASSVITAKTCVSVPLPACSLPLMVAHATLCLRRRRLQQQCAGAAQTTLYSYDFTNNDLVTIGSVSGSPNSPNGGQVSTVGPSGVTASSGTAADLGFDIGGDGIGYLNLVAGGASGLYTANLSTGMLSLIGNFAAGVTLLGVTEAPTTNFAVANFPSPTAAGAAGTFTVTALDPYGVIVPTYAGTVTFTSSDPAATLPANSTLTNGLGTFTATFNTQGPQSLTASDVAVPTINGTQSGIVVSGTVSPPPPPGPPGPPPPPAVLGSKIGVIQPATVVRTGVAALDSNGNGVFDSSDAIFTFGFTSDKYVAGDWNNLGFDSLGVVPRLPRAWPSGSSIPTATMPTTAAMPSTFTASTVTRPWSATGPAAVRPRSVSCAPAPTARRFGR